MHHAFKMGESEHGVELSRSADAYCLHLGEISVSVNLKTGADSKAWLTVGGKIYEVVIATLGDQAFIHLNGAAYQLSYQHPLDRLAATGHGAADDSIRAPMPGSLVSVQVKAGDSVTRGQTLLVMESMKMETTLTSPRDGVIAEVRFEKGQTFDRDAVLATFAEEKK